MTLWGYAIGWAHSVSLPVAPGVAGDPVRLLNAFGLSLVCSAAPERDVKPPPVDQVMAYARVIEELQRTTTIVPLRYGKWEGPANELRDRLGQHTEAIGAALDRVAGREEWTIHIDRPDRSPLPPLSTVGGHEYLRARQALYARLEDERTLGEELTRQVQATLMGICELVELDSSTIEGTIVLHLLACRGRGEALRLALARLPILARLSGPYPPYHYARFES